MKNRQQIERENKALTNELVQYLTMKKQEREMSKIWNNIIAAAARDKQ